MNNFKFRAWHKTWLKMCMVAEIDFSGKGDIDRLELYEEMNTVNDCDIEDVYLMQWTGLQDARGKDIYEGDIIIADWHYTKPFVIDDLKTFYYAILEYGLENECKILGNIYENPDLITPDEMNV